MKVSTVWLKDFVTLAPPLERIADRLTLAGLEVKKVEFVPNSKDTVFEIEITSNRPDWLSHLGVAREIAAVENISFKNISHEDKGTRPQPKGWKVQVKDVILCPFYTAVYIEGVQQVQTPDFMRDRLAACGIRSISFLVDVTNYVMLETGQPLHAFDADLIGGQEIIVRPAKDKENFVAINGEIHELSAQDLVIADKDKAVALAGVMGGKNTEVSAATRNIMLESAFFSPRNVRQTSLRTGIRSDSSYRFERRVDPEMVDVARERAIDLIRQYAAPRFISGVIRAGHTSDGGRARIHMTHAEVNKHLGVEIKPHAITSILTRLGLEVKNDSADSWNIGVPSFRADLTRSIDLIEEIARIYGYDQIPETLPSAPLCGKKNSPIQNLLETARGVLTGAGFYETVTFSLIPEKGLSADEISSVVKIHNPQNKELTIMRPHFIPSFLSVIEKNIRQGASSVSGFEIAHLYSSSGAKSQPNEDKSLGFFLFGKKPKSWAESDRMFSYYDMKGVLELFISRSGVNLKLEPSQNASFRPQVQERIMSGKECFGIIGQVSDSLCKLWSIEGPVFYAHISLSKMSAATSAVRRFEEMPKYPPIQRDLSIIVSESTKSSSVTAEIVKAGGELVRSVELFDLFQGGRVPKGFKNLAFRVVYQSAERTLVSDEIQALHQSIGETLSQMFGAKFQ